MARRRRRYGSNAPKKSGGLFGLPMWLVLAGGAAAAYYFFVAKKTTTTAVAAPTGPTVSIAGAQVPVATVANAAASAVDALARAV